MKLALFSLLTMTMSLLAESPQVFTLKNKAGMEVTITNYGAIVTSMRVPDKNGKLEDVVLGFDKAEEYIAKPANPYFGAVVGRYGNRIAKGKFTLEGKEYQLATNNGPNALHGGLQGFSKRFWKPALSGNTLTLDYTSADMEEGYPGELKVRVVYRLTDDNALQIDYTANTNKTTVLNVTNHSYFNLTGPSGKDILGHILKLNASKFTPVDATLIPTGELRPVAGTPFDFLKPTAIGARMDQKEQQIQHGGGYDHNFVLDKSGAAGPQQAAEVYDPISGRVLTVSTTEPGVQFYTGNFLDGTFQGKGGKAYTKRMAFCLETQHYPDSPNHPAFPTTTLKPGQTYKSTTVFRFSVR
ncbi:aldose epimerase family protein [Bryobacter aggregatus]|uniref:aldose epimerase family protein n=1 Tax=Bryobacter aggregatus TaxID=360054 RepID=UPI0009B5A5DE|nr:aldose epimerase family protein [Bryobacter aggregatus]